MSKLVILSSREVHRRYIEDELINSQINYATTQLFPIEYKNMFCIQLKNVESYYDCRNVYEIKYGNSRKTKFIDFIFILKKILIEIDDEIHICLQWDGNDDFEINTIYDKKIINLYSYQFPEDKFEFDFNVDYIFVYKKIKRDR